MNNKELGSAGFSVDLSDGVITIKHFQCGSVLAQWDANIGDWDLIWKTIRNLENKA